MLQLHVVSGVKRWQSAIGVGVLGLFLTVGGAYSTASHSTWRTEAWGFHAHRLINRRAVFALPKEMLPFYKKHIAYLEEAATLPDRRRYAVPGESALHYIDLDVLVRGDVARLPIVYDSARALLGDTALSRHGRLPWTLLRETRRLEEAFFRRDATAILRTSAELGHYLADAHVPLHTTSNYNGQFTGQWGIHGLWEQRLPEVYSETYNTYLRPAAYVQRPSELIWRILAESHAQVEGLLAAERTVRNTLPEGQWYSVERRGGRAVRAYSKRFSGLYQQRVGPQVADRFKASCQHLADLWYTAWVNAGQPPLDSLGVPAPYLELLPADSVATDTSGRVELHR